MTKRDLVDKLEVKLHINNSTLLLDLLDWMFIEVLSDWSGLVRYRVWNFWRCWFYCYVICEWRWCCHASEELYFHQILQVRNLSFLVWMYSAINWMLPTVTYLGVDSISIFYSMWCDGKFIVHRSIQVLAKIESLEALHKLHEIVAASDGIMIARGDLGVEIPLEQIPTVQEEITYVCRQLNKPVLVASQLLESMVEYPTPTRAEVANSYP